MPNRILPPEPTDADPIDVAKHYVTETMASVNAGRHPVPLLALKRAVARVSAHEAGRLEQESASTTLV